MPKSELAPAASPNPIRKRDRLAARSWPVPEPPHPRQRDQEATADEGRQRRLASGVRRVLIVTIAASAYFFGACTPSSSTMKGQAAAGLALKVPFFTILIFILVSPTQRWPRHVPAKSSADSKLRL